MTIKETHKSILLAPSLTMKCAACYTNWDLCSSVNEFKDNFHSLYGKAPLCKLCGLHIDSQELSLSCEKVKENLTEAELMIINKVKYNDIYREEERQLIITQIFQKILQIRATASIPPASLPGLYNLGPDWLVIVSYWKYIYICRPGQNIKFATGSESDPYRHLLTTTGLL